MIASQPSKVSSDTTPIREKRQECLRQQVLEKRRRGVVSEAFWHTGEAVIDHEETVHPSPVDRLFANAILAPVFVVGVVVGPWVVFGSLLSSDASALGGVCLVGLPYALVLLLFYGGYMSLLSNHTVRISLASGTIEEIITTKHHSGKIYALMTTLMRGGLSEKRTSYPLKEVRRIDLHDPFADEASGPFIFVRGMNILGRTWKVDITPFHRELYRQGKRSPDRRRMAAIKTAERYADVLGVEIASRISLADVSWDLRDEFDDDWVLAWSDRTAVSNQNRRLLDEEQKQRQEVQ